jgi:hypothetical protein
MKVENRANEKKVPAQIYSRVVGYYSPIVINDDGTAGRGNTWNKGKFEEFKQRKMYKI